MNKLLISVILLAATGCATTETIQDTAPPQEPTTPEKTAPKQAVITPEMIAEHCEEALVESSKITIGDVEFVELVREKVGYDARIDTGATTSSLGAFNIVEFERDGKRWVKFTLEPEETSKVYEYPLLRITPITNPSKKTVTRRPVIEMMMSLGGEHYKAEFNLTDRSHMTFKILIGREFLQDRVIVDVSHKHLMKGE